MEKTCCFSFILSILSSFFLLFPKQVTAQYFFEGFESINTDVWVLHENNGVINSTAGRLLLSGDGVLAPYVHDSGNVDVFPDSGDFSVKIIFSYPGLTYWGVGVGIGSEVPNNDVSATVSRENDHLYSQFGVWQDLTGGLVVYYRHCDGGVCKDEGSYVGREVVNIVASPGELDEEDHILEINYVASRYYIYIDRNVNPDPVIISEVSDEIPERIWFGNPIRTGGVPWTSLSIDSVRVESLDQDSGEKIVLLPGLGGSWNTEALVTGVDVTDEEWKLTPFFDGYNGLISTFEANGYVQGEDLFVYTYDWRDSLDDISSRFSDFLSSNFDSSDKVDLVGHSLGGLVARNYEQKNNDSKINKVVTLGSPHRGAVGAYRMWAGGRIKEKRTLASIALGILLKIQSGQGWGGWQTIRNQTPVIGDITPSFDFAYRGFSPLPLSQMSSKNDFLINLNLEKEFIFPKLEAVAGNGFDTPGKVFLGQRTFYDQVLGLWPDGHLLGEGVLDGDSTVLVSSASFEEDLSFGVGVDHSGLVDQVEGVDTLMEVLGLEKQSIEFEENDLSSTLLFLLGSPARLEVLAPGGELVLSDEQGMVSFSSFVPGIYEVLVTGEGDGVYHLLSGVLGNELSYLESETSLGKEDTYFFSIDSDGEIEMMDSNKVVWLQLARDLIKRRLGEEGDLEEALLNIGEAIDNVSDCSLAYEKVNLALANLFLYRFEEVDLQKRGISERVVEYLIKAGVGFGECMGELERVEIENSFLKMRQLKSLVNAKLRFFVEKGGVLEISQAEVYQKAESLLVEVLSDLNDGKYWEAEMKLGVIDLCLQEALGG